MKEGGDLQEWEWLQTAFSFMRATKGSGVVSDAALLPPAPLCPMSQKLYSMVLGSKKTEVA